MTPRSIPSSRSIPRRGPQPGPPVPSRSGSSLVGAVFPILLLLLLLPATGSAQATEERRPPPIERGHPYDLSVGLGMRSWEDDRIEEAAGPDLVLRRSLVGPFRARLRLATLRAAVSLAPEPVPSRMYFGAAGLEVSPPVRLTRDVVVHPGLYATLGMAVTDPDSTGLGNRSQNVWGGGIAAHVVYRRRWIAGIEYERTIVQLEDPAAEGRPDALRTSTDLFSLRVGLRF